MPSLKDTLRSTSPAGFMPVGLPAPDLPVALPGQLSSLRLNPSLRSTLPPINAGPDTLRQFNESGGAPARRVFPLPVGNNFGSGTTINNTVVTDAGSSGSSSVSSLSAKIVTVSTGLINPSTSVSQIVTMAKSFQLIACSATGSCEVRLYGSATAQAIDSARATDAPLAAELLNNLITDVVFDTAPFVWEWQNRIGVNSNNPQTTSLYVTIFNTSSAQAQIQISISYLPLES